MVCLHLHTVTVIALPRLHGSEKLLKVFANSSKNHVFYGPKLNL